MNKYYYRARLLPTAITCVPLFILVHSVILKKFSQELTPIFAILPTLTSLGISLALVFLLTQINRVISKEIFQKFYFKEESYMPTTNFLLYQDDFYNQTIKEKIRDKIRAKYGIDMYDEIKESSDILSSRKNIVFAVSQIRNSLRDNQLLFQHNIEYGFFRNLIGGCVLAVLFSIGVLIYALLNSIPVLINLSIILLVVYCLPILLSKKILSIYSKNYAKILYEQFISLP